MVLKSLHVYPVKSFRGIDRTSAAIDGMGLADDRRYMVVDPAGLFLTQRTVPRMALVDTAIDERALVLSADGHGSVSIPRVLDRPPLRPVVVWRSGPLMAQDCGDEAAAWLSAFLAIDCRLVHTPPDFDRPVAKAPHSMPGDRVGFADDAPLLLVGQASLDVLNDRLAQRGEPPVEMVRFRTNLVVDGTPPFAEDNWGRFRIGNVHLRNGWRCARCIVTVTDPQTAARGKEPLRTLATFRRDAGQSDVFFGQNVLLDSPAGTLHVGDRLTLEV